VQIIISTHPQPPYSNLTAFIFKKKKKKKLLKSDGVPSVAPLVFLNPFSAFCNRIQATEKKHKKQQAFIKGAVV
jgi:hypothetical protein